MSSNTKVVCQVITEFLEGAVHNILKIREIYPEAIFVKKQKYGVIVYQTIHPQLKEYITNCMQAVYEIAMQNQLEKMVIVFIKSHEIFEKIVFDVSGFSKVIEEDPFLLDIEKTFRSFFCNLPLLNDYLYPLTEDVTFSLQIYTTESSGIAYMEDPASQNFPWMQINPSYNEIHDSEIVPVETVDNFENLQIYIEKYK